MNIKKNAYRFNERRYGYGIVGRYVLTISSRELSGKDIWIFIVRDTYVEIIINKFVCAANFWERQIRLLSVIGFFILFFNHVVKYLYNNTNSFRDSEHPR